MLNETWFLFQNNQLLISQQNRDDPFIFPNNVDRTDLLYQHLLSIEGDQRFYCAELPTDYPIAATHTLMSMRQALEYLGLNWLNFVSRAYAILTWDKNNQFCGKCGQLTVLGASMCEKICPSCQLSFYPRISPSIIVLIYRDNEILMARGPHFTSGVYGLIAGFVDAGESVEQAVHREVNEEVGLKIKNLKFCSSQPWPFPDSLMLGFTAEYESGEVTINYEEVEDAAWYSIHQLPKRPSNLSIAYRLIDQFLIEHSSRINKG